MLFAEGCAEALGQPLGFLFLAVMGCCWLGKKFLAGNPEVGKAAGKMVAGKAIGMMGRWFR